MLRFALLFLFLVPVSGFAQGNEIGFVVGGTTSPNSGIPFSVIGQAISSTANLQFGTGITYEGVLAHRLLNAHIASIYLELPVLGSPNRDLNSNNYGNIGSFSSIFVTPSLKLKISGPGFSPFLSAGGGIAHFTTTPSGSSQSNGSTTGALQLGAGLDISTPIPFLALRGEVREFLTGHPEPGRLYRRFQYTAQYLLWRRPCGALLKSEATVHGKNLPGNELWARSEEQDRRSNVRCGPISLHWSFFREMAGLFRDLALRKCNHAGSDAIHADLRGQGLRHGLGQHVQRGLRGAVMGMGGPRLQPSQRADIDNSPSMLPQLRRAGLGHQKWAAHVGGKHRIELCCGNIGEINRLIGPGIVDQQIQGPEFLMDLLHRSLDRAFLLQIAIDGMAFAAQACNLLDHPLGFGLGLAIGDRDARPGLCQRQGQLAANTPPSSGYQSGFSL